MVWSDLSFGDVHYSLSDDTTSLLPCKERDVRFIGYGKDRKLNCNYVERKEKCPFSIKDSYFFKHFLQDPLTGDNDKDSY